MSSDYFCMSKRSSLLLFVYLYRHYSQIRKIQHLGRLFWAPQIWLSGISFRWKPFIVLFIEVEIFSREIPPRFKSSMKLLFWTKGVEWVKVLNALGLLCLWQCLVETPGPAFYNQIEKWKGRQHSLLNKALISNIIFPLNALLQSRLFLNME